MSAPRSRSPVAPGSSKKTQAASDPAQVGLRLREKSDRLAALLRDHQRLLTKIKQKKKELQRLSEQLQTTLTEFMGRLQPVVNDIANLDREVHALFAELLARKRQPQGTLAAIRRVYKTLQDGGMLSRRPAAGSDLGADRVRKDREPPAGSPQWEELPPPKDPNHFTARPPGEGAASQSLRRLFHRLVMAIHPDTVQPEAEKSRRTEVMKEITRAYKEGDLARLLDLERTWMADGTLAAQNDESDGRYAALVRTNQELRAQLEQIKSELKDLRRSPQAGLLADFEAAARFSGKDPVSAAVAEASHEREQLRAILDFVELFRDGRLDLDEFLRGPISPPDQELDELDDFLSILFEETQRQPPRQRKKGRTRGGPGMHR